jgi:hypothetical protein
MFTRNPSGFFREDSQCMNGFLICQCFGLNHSKINGRAASGESLCSRKHAALSLRTGRDRTGRHLAGRSRMGFGGSRPGVRLRAVALWRHGYSGRLGLGAAASFRRLKTEEPAEAVFAGVRPAGPDHDSKYRPLDASSGRPPAEVIIFLYNGLVGNYKTHF